MPFDKWEAADFNALRELILIEDLLYINEPREPKLPPAAVLNSFIPIGR